MRITLKKVLYPLFSLLLFFSLLYISLSYSSEEISTFISNAGIFAPLLYILIQITGQTFAPLSTSALFIAGFIMFGKKAIFYLLIVWLISSALNFYIARRYGKRFLKKIIGEGGLEKIEDISKRIDTKNIFLLRLSTFYINDFASYAFGFTKVSFKEYYLFTILSMIPWAVIMSLIANQNDNILFTTAKIILSMIPFAILTYIFLRKKF